MKCKHNFRVDSNFLACQCLLLLLLSRIEKCLDLVPRVAGEKRKKKPTVRDFVTVPVIRVRYIDVKKKKERKTKKITQRIGNFPIDVIVSENEIAKLFFLLFLLLLEIVLSGTLTFFTRISRFDTPLALASLLLLLFAELLFKWNGERKKRKEKKRKGKKRIERTRR